MKRVIPLFVVLVAGLSILLYTQLRKQQLAAERASGGSATVEGTQIDVVARLPARIEAIEVAAGSAVKQGQVLVRLDCAEQEALLAQADAALEGAKIALSAANTAQELSQQGIRGADSQLWLAHATASAAESQKQVAAVQHDAAERDSQRLQKVHLAGAVTGQKLDHTKAQAEGLNYQVKAMDANVQAAKSATAAASSAREAAVIRAKLAVIETAGAEQQVRAAEAAKERAQVAVSECTLRAPRDGYVLERNYEVGEVVMPGSRVLTLVDIREVKATFYLPNAELAAAAPGKPVEVRADTYGDRVFAGSIVRVGVEAEFTPRNVQTRQDRDRLVYAVEVAVPNPEGALRPGMPVEITIPGTAKGSG